MTGILSGYVIYIAGIVGTSGNVLGCGIVTYITFTGHFYIILTTLDTKRVIID